MAEVSLKRPGVQERDVSIRRRWTNNTAHCVTRPPSHEGFSGVGIPAAAPVARDGPTLVACAPAL